ncbi:hypothetical protein FRC01_007378 [Tulasnella sp. 417]|nr:hypothetical protein FRC01_007378 [Tulasnella sp. 417]
MPKSAAVKTRSTEPEQPQGKRSSRAKKGTAAGDHPDVAIPAKGGPEVKPGEIDWLNEPELTDALLTSIEEDSDIRQGLFPGCGGNASTAKGGGKSKSKFHKALARMIFAGHGVHGDVYTRASPHEKKEWGKKIKNCLEKLKKMTISQIEELGETGYGIRDESEIDTSKKNGFTNAWVVIKEKNPWFFQMRDLIQYRPNALVPLSGNSTSSVDPGIFLSSDRAEDPWETSGFEDVDEVLAEAETLILETSGTSGLASDDDPEYIDTEDRAAPPLERIAEEDKEKIEQAGIPKRDVIGKTEPVRTAKTNTSVPTQIPMCNTSKTSKANPISAFADAAIAEETTRREEEITVQKELELRKAQYEYDMLQLKLRASLKRDTEEWRERARKERQEARLLDKKHEREFELEKLRL